MNEDKKKAGRPNAYPKGISENDEMKRRRQSKREKYLQSTMEKNKSRLRIRGKYVKVPLNVLANHIVTVEEIIVAPNEETKQRMGESLERIKALNVETQG